MTPNDVLREAAQVIRERGHHKGNYEDPNTGAVCAIGAVRVVTHGRTCYPDDVDGGYGAACAELVRRVSGDPDSPFSVTSVVGYWNDAPERTADEVIALLEGKS